MLLLLMPFIITFISAGIKRQEETNEKVVMAVATLITNDNVIFKNKHSPIASYRHYDCDCSCAYSPWPYSTLKSDVVSITPYSLPFSSPEGTQAHFYSLLNGTNPPTPRLEPLASVWETSPLATTPLARPNIRKRAIKYCLDVSWNNKSYSIWQ